MNFIYLTEYSFKNENNNFHRIGRFIREIKKCMIFPMAAGF